MTETTGLVLASQTWSAGEKVFYVIGCLLVAALVALLFSGKD
jgi:hypothetical protein